jgi:hypothetical protein
VGSNPLSLKAKVILRKTPWQETVSNTALKTTVVNHVSCGIAGKGASVAPTTSGYVAAADTQSASSQARSATASASTPYAQRGAGEPEATQNNAAASIPTISTNIPRSGSGKRQKRSETRSSPSPWQAKKTKRLCNVLKQRNWKLLSIQL